MNQRYFCVPLLLPVIILASCAPAVVAGSTANPTPGPILAITAEATTWPALPPETCPVTPPPVAPFLPPEPYGTYPYESHIWYGTPELWTAIPIDGRWYSLPYTEGRGYTQKVVFWNESYDWRTEQQPELSLSGHRLDGDAPDFVTDHATNGYHDELGAFILTGVEIPTLGCWEMTARYRGADVSFVVWVAP